MKDFYKDPINFNHFCDKINMILLNESFLKEGWLEQFYMANKYRTTAAVERHACNKLLIEINSSEISKKELMNIIDRRLDSEVINESSLTDKLYLINNISNINLVTFESILNDFELEESIVYIKENIYNGNINNDISKNKLPINYKTKRIFRTLNEIESYLEESINNYEELKRIQNLSEATMYKFKELLEGRIIQYPLNQRFDYLSDLLEEASDEVINYALNELKYINNQAAFYLENFEVNNEALLYNQAVEQFNFLVEDIFITKINEDINFDDMVKLYKITNALCDYESTMEASSRIITKGTEKITKAVGNASAKSHGMSKSDSKVDQVKRGAKIVDDRVSTALNRKIDDLINLGRESKREKLITGKNTIRVGNTIKSVLKSIAIGTGLYILKGPVVGTIIALIGLLAKYALSKRTEAREKKRIILELETELKIVKEKIEDAKGDNAKKEKYQLMRIQAELEKEIERIRYNLNYY